MHHVVIRESQGCAGDRAIGVLYYCVAVAQCVFVPVGQLVCCLYLSSSWMRFALFKSQQINVSCAQRIFQIYFFHPLSDHLPRTENITRLNWVQISFRDN